MSDGWPSGMIYGLAAGRGYASSLRPGRPPARPWPMWCNTFLTAKKALLDSGELAERTFKLLYATCDLDREGVRQGPARR